MDKRYALEVYLPDNPGYDVAFYIESDTQFLPIQKGDLLNPRTWNGHYAAQVRHSRPEFEHGVVLRVTGVEHFILQRENGDFAGHKLGIFTTAEPDIEQSRP